jgi:formylglycine-generating enzyme required for sulfatase activity
MTPRRHGQARLTAAQKSPRNAVLLVLICCFDEQNSGIGGFGMGCWFLSYNSQDLALMQGLEAALRRKDPEAEIFFAPTSLRAGGFWLPELAKGIAAATAFVLLVGDKSLGPWQVIEYYEALDRRVKQHDFPVILVLLDGVPAPGLPFLRQLHWIITADPASEKSVSQVMDAAAGGGALPGELWRHTAPYRGLAAMTEADSDFFFGRGRETVDVIRALEATPDKLAVLLGNSGVGKSSLAQAGVLAAFVRQAWPETAEAPGSWPQAFSESRHWCVLTLKPGTEPVRALVEPFLRTWQFDAVDPARAKLQASWVGDLLAGAVSLRDLLDATELRYHDDLNQPKPPAFLLYIDQGEELYVRADERQRQRFSQILAEGLGDPRLRALMSLRADFFGDLQKDEALDDASRKIEVKPLREGRLHEVVSRPAALLGARFETDHLAADIARRAAEESTKDAGALPLLSYLLDDMWKSRDAKWDGVLRLSAPAIELGRVLVERANAFMATHADAEDMLRRIFTLKLCTVREDGEPTRRRAARAEFSDQEWGLVSELADHPNRLLVTVTPEADTQPAALAGADAKLGLTAGETYAEIAHEAIFRRWDKLRDWVAAEREFLAWRSGLEAAWRAWKHTPHTSKPEALLIGAALTKAQNWLAKRAEDMPAPHREFIAQSTAREERTQARARRVRSLNYALLMAIIVGLVGWIEQSFIREQWLWWTTQRPFVSANIWPYVLKPLAERALKPGDSFRDCAVRQQNADYCPDMVVVVAGTFAMGAPETIEAVHPNELPQHRVTIAEPFAVSKFKLTFAEWDACIGAGGCGGYRPRSDAVWGRGQQPVIYVSWNDAQQYVAWLSKITGKTYRLLTEAEYEYATRAGSTTLFPWGETSGENNANCKGCGGKWDGRPAPVGSFTTYGFVGSFPPNAFGLYDMVGNVWEWTEDCYHDDYEGAPPDGSAWTAGGNCDARVIRGGSWNEEPFTLRSWLRRSLPTDRRSDVLGFRIGRTLSAGAGAITVAPGAH